MWRSRIDQGIRRALGITILVVAVAKLSSWAFDHWLGDRHDEIVANQEALSQEVLRRASEEDRALREEKREANCRGILERAPCLWPADFREAGQCLVHLAQRQCDQLDDVQLCAAVESLEACSDVFADQGKNGCNQLRRQAQCRTKPAPEDREGLWEIVLDDGLWHGEET